MVSVNEPSQPIKFLFLSGFQVGDYDNLAPIPFVFHDPPWAIFGFHSQTRYIRGTNICEWSVSRLLKSNVLDRSSFFAGVQHFCLVRSLKCATQEPYGTLSRQDKLNVLERLPFTCSRVFGSLRDGEFSGIFGTGGVEKSARMSGSETWKKSRF